MGRVLAIVVFVVFAIVCQAQTDSTKTSKKIKEAPEDLKKLIEEVQAEKAKKVSKDAEIEIDGLLVDETKTRSGRDFYEFFFQDWEAPKSARNYSIFITEKPFRLNTTQIEIKINETLVFQSFLQPRADIVETLAEQAVAQTFMYLQNYEAIIKQLEGDDRSGSGIF